LAAPHLEASVLPSKGNTRIDSVDGILLSQSISKSAAVSAHQYSLNCAVYVVSFGSTLQLISLVPSGKYPVKGISEFTPTRYNVLKRDTYLTYTICSSFKL